MEQLGMKKQNIFYGLAFLALIYMYVYHFSDIPFIRMDDGWLLQAPRMLADNYKLAAPMLENGWNQTNYWHQHPPFYYVCLALFFKIFGFGIVQARLFSVILAVVSGYVFIRLISYFKINLQINAAWAILLLFTTPLFYVLAKSTRPEMLFLLLSLLSFTFLVRWNEEQKFSNLAFGAVSTGLLCLTHYYALHMLILWAIVIIRMRRLRQLIVWCAIFGIVFVPYILWISSNFQAFYDQVLVARGLSSFHIVSRVKGIIKYFITSKQTILIAAYLIIGMMIQLYCYKRKRNIAWKLVLLAPILFIMQFLVLPRINYLYAIAMVPFIYMIFLFAVDDGNRRLMSFVIAGMVIINVCGTLAYIYKYRKYNYQEYRHQFIDRIPLMPNSVVLGRASLYPIFADTDFQAYEAFELSSDWRERLKEVIAKSNYVIVDEFSRRNRCGDVILDDDMLNYIHGNMELYASFTSLYYGSEGTINNNNIEIYSNQRGSWR